MSTLPVDNPGIASVPVSSVGDVARLINSGKEHAKYARMIVFLALGGVFLDAYDLTTLSYGIDDVVREFQLSPLLTGLVTSSIMVGTIVGNIIGGWLTDKYGRYSVFMADMFFFVISAIAAGLAPNVWVLIGARFLMGIGVGIDLPVAMSYLAEFSRFAGKGNKAARLAAWCPMWYAASTVCFLIIFGLYFLLPQEHLDWLWRASLLFGAVPALLIIAVRSRFMNESPLWAANQGDLTSAVRILRDSWGIHAHEVPAAKPAPAPKVSFRVLFEKPYRERTIVAGVMNICISFEYTAIAFFLPSILAQFLGAGVFETISASLGLNALFAFTGGLLGMHLAWKISFASCGDSRLRPAVCGADCAGAGGATARDGRYRAGYRDAGAVAVRRRVWPGGAADDLPGALLSYCHSRHRGRFQPGTLRDRQRAGVVYSAAAAGLPRHADVLGGLACRHYSHFLPAGGPS
ncbi:transporter [Klebsiella pneumoniae]|nr:transporter [Klebsiella pneumoniae]